MTDISTRAKRARLAVRRDPHFQKLSTGVYLGWRATADSWIARVRDRAEKQHFKPLDLPGDLPVGGEFDAAKNLCETFAALIRGGSRVIKFAQIGDVVVGPYFDHLRRQGREQTIADALKVFKRCLIGNPKLGRAPDPLALVCLSDATDADFLGWRDRIAALPVKPQTKNNYIKFAKAALTRAVKAGYAGNAAAWGVVERFAEAKKDKARAAYLSKEQRGSLLRGCVATKYGVALADFLRGMYEGGARPIDASRAKVGDFDARRGTVTWYTPKGSRTHEFRPYVHPLSASGIAFFASVSAGKRPCDPLLPAPGGGVWDRREIGAAVTAARAIANAGRSDDDVLFLPTNAQAYSMRHSKITDMIEIGHCNVLKVAARCGTSVRMIEATYYHLLEREARDEMSLLQAA